MKTLAQIRDTFAENVLKDIKKNAKRRGKSSKEKVKCVYKDGEYTFTVNGKEVTPFGAAESLYPDIADILKDG